MEEKKRAKFSGNLGYVLATAGSAVGLGNIWRFPYLAAKYGGGIFILIYIILGVTFGYTLIISETVLGRISRKSPIGAFKHFSQSRLGRVGGWLNAIVPVIIVPYYCVIGGWVLRYLTEYIVGNSEKVVREGYFTDFITSASGSEVFFLLFSMITLLVVVLGVNAGVERISTLMMPVLMILAALIAVYSITRPGALEGVRYALVPDFSKFSFMTVVAAMGQMFYSLSIAMGILYTFGSYMKRDVDIERSTYQVAIVDSLVAILAVLMVIPSIFAFADGDVSGKLNAGPALLFISLPNVFADMAGGKIVGILFFVMVLFAALTSSIALLESTVSTLEDEFHLGRKGASAVMALVIVVLGSLSSLGYNLLSDMRLLGMQFLDFFDFLSNSVLMPIGAMATCILIFRCVGIAAVTEEVERSSKFGSKRMYAIILKYLAPVLLGIILVSSVLNTLGIIAI
ncbi:MAG: sodium-dependent transporter [Eubacteriales bacterium]|nr:sodium-dependent transporter [Eubacteriales bacterium]